MGTETDARVTIVVPTYRRPLYLTHCLESIRAQTYTNFVVTICDNSPDREGEAIVEALGDSRFSYVPRPRNLGIFGNAVQGLAAARTELVMEVDDDDLLLPECLATLVPAFDDPLEVSIAFGEAHVTDDAGRRMSPEQGARYIPASINLPVGFIHSSVKLAAAGLVFLNAAILRHSAIDWEQIPWQAATAYDRYITLAAARNGRAIFHTTTPVLEYRVHTMSDSLVSSSDQHYGALYVLSAERLRTPPEHRAWIESEMLRTELFLAKSLLEARERRDAWRQLARLFRRPELPRALWSLTRTYGGAHARCRADRVFGVIGGRLHRW